MHQLGFQRGLPSQLTCFCFVFVKRRQMWIRFSKKIEQHLLKIWGVHQFVLFSLFIACYRIGIRLSDTLASLNSTGLNSWQSAKHLLHWPVFFPSDSEGALYDQVRWNVKQRRHLVVIWYIKQIVKLSSSKPLNISLIYSACLVWYFWGRHWRKSKQTTTDPFKFLYWAQHSWILVKLWGDVNLN